MSLYVDSSGGDPTADLVTISWNDGALGLGGTSTLNTSIGTITVVQVTYPAATTGQASATRLSLLASSTSADGLDWGWPIVITPLNGGINPYTGVSIKGNGETFLDTATQVIHVVYDISNCEGAGIQVFDTGGNPITTPSPVVLYHELSHAYHFALTQFPYPQNVCSGASYSGSDEPAAEVDENILRAQLGLCLRNPCNHDAACGSGSNCSGSSTAPSGGSSSGASLPSGASSNPSGVPSGPASGPPSGPASGPLSGPASGPPSGPASHLPSGFPSAGHASGSTPQGGCFIVSAATGSPHSAEVALLQQLRRRVASSSRICGQLIEGILREYYRYSPQIASEIERDALVRMAVLSMVVRPLVAWFTLARAVCFEWDDRTAVSVAAQEVLTACPRRLAPKIVPLLEAVRADQPWPADAPRQLLAFAPKIREAVRLPLASWGLLDPLLRAWTVTTHHLDVIGEVSQWLATAPIQTYVRSIAPEALDEELATLAGFYNFCPSARLRIGSGLVAVLPDSVEALKRYGFVEQ